MFPLKVYLKLLCEKSHISGAFWGFFDKKTAAISRDVSPKH